MRRPLTRTPSAQPLARATFRDAVFARDQSRCVICRAAAVDAHHILERRLFDDGGYYLDNGAALCEAHHRAAEQTVLSVEDIRAACGITRAVLPPHLYADQPYDKWGNPILADGRRLKGELFDDAGVQHNLLSAGLLDRFTNRCKYPRTHHVPWSAGMHDDDRMRDDMLPFLGQRVVVTEKLDGENTTLYCDGMHARSVDSPHHVSRDWVKGFWGRIAADIPEHWRVCVENLYARHSIAYDRLPSYVIGLSVWDQRNVCLSWDTTLDWFALLGLTAPPVLFDGIYDEAAIRALYVAERDWASQEGYVIRLAGEFPYRGFRRSVAKFVRAGHITTTKHWMRGQKLERNRLA